MEHQNIWQNTNPVKLFGLLKKDDFNEQLCYYQSGVGTYVNPGMVSPLLEWGAKVLDEAFAIFLNDHVMDGYRFLMDNYRAGDKICIFGFSRGSYTARALAGMLHKVGLLPRDNQEQVPFAYKMYQKTSAAGIELAAGYKQTFCQTVQVDFLGIWDTVSSVGVIMSRTLPYTSVNSSVKTFRHAVALDEHRVRFQPYLLEPKPQSNGKTSDEPYSGPTDTLEVWFSGCHTDIGGGSVVNSVARSLADITLRWMVRQIMASTCDVRFDPAALRAAGIPTDAASSNETAVEDADSSEPLDDDLAGVSGWWLLEVFPLIWPVQNIKGAWHNKFGFHLGKGRTIIDPNPKFHYTVKERMANSALKYRPKAQWTAGTEVYVE
ncbi:hypothetical protein MSAN_01775300 [Mycena sanguinolenta]|uniref:T6SS Phospholipase effector Tle1-like catalytic domain-containing protein n=1 Tax=Mycena sanguinolenta TaxID=230812 RepID=A0A8H7CS28_9AGAR|nr:hypothetical protein MSAN_01775300 [Mycena sanguinolenta]